MSEAVKYIQDLGLVTALIGLMLWLGIKYLPKWIELKLNRANEKDYMMDSFKAVIENNSKVIDNNSEVIKINSTTIKNYTDNAFKLENKVEEHNKIFENKFDEQNKIIQTIYSDVEILKDRK